MMDKFIIKKIELPEMPKALLIEPVNRKKKRKEKKRKIRAKMITRKIYFFFSNLPGFFIL